MKNLPATTIRTKRRSFAQAYLAACKIENVEERKAALRAIGCDPL